jgi:hypothetical protein
MNEWQLRQLASNPVPSGWTGIHFLAALYLRYGDGAARTATRVIAEATGSGTFAYFGGFIRTSDTSGFREEVRDPTAANPQTGHFFSYVVWAVDEDVSLQEYAAGLGHEFLSDRLRDPLQQAWEGVPGAFDLFRVVTGLPLDIEFDVDYADLDRQFAAYGWPDRIHPHDEHGLPTGNSIADLRLTVAGFHLGRLMFAHPEITAEQAALWIERNILEDSCRELSDADMPEGRGGGSAVMDSGRGAARRRGRSE